MSEKYSRQIILKEIGKKGQDRLSRSSVAIIGVGAIGSNSAELLTRAGVGTIILVDRDYVEESNLHRQTLFTEADLDSPKAIAARDRLISINSKVRVVGEVEDVTWRNIVRLVGNSDVILDGTDNLETRFLINDFSVKNKKPWIYAGCVGTEGVSFNVVPGEVCLRCIIPKLPKIGSLDTCDTRGALNTLPWLVVARQVTECLKILLGEGWSRKFFYVNLWDEKYELLDVKKSESCPVCNGRYEYLEGKGSSATRVCGRDTFQVRLSREVDFELLTDKLKGVDRVSTNKWIVHFTTGDKRLSVFKDGRVIVKGVSSESEARSVVGKYLG